MSSDDDARETILTPASPPVLEGSLAPSPYNFLFTGEDNLRITSHNSQSGVAIAVQGRMWSPRDGIRPFGFVHVPFTDRSARTEAYPLGEGYLLNLSVFAQQGSPRLGQTFVRVQVIRGLHGATYVLGTLVQDYLTSNQDLAWPGSPIRRASDGDGYARTISGTLPIVGTEVSEAVPTGASWELSAFQVSYTTDITNVNRLVSLRLLTGIIYTFISYADVQIGPSVTVNLIWAAGCSVVDQVLPNNGTGFLAPLPARHVLRAGQFLTTVSVTLQAGDSYGQPQFQVIERLDVL